MRNYLKAELYRNLKRKQLWVTILCISLFGLLGIIGFAYMEYQELLDNCNMELFITAGIEVMFVYTYCMLSFVSMSFGEEIKNNTIKNILSSGVSRTKIYIAKIIEAIILATICALCILTICSVLSYFILGIGNISDVVSIMQECLKKGVVAMCLWAGVIAEITLLTLLFRNGVTTTLIYICIYLMLGTVLYQLGKYINPIFMKLEECLISTHIKQIALQVDISNEALLNSVTLGLGYLVIFTVIGCIIINKKDI